MAMVKLELGAEFDMLGHKEFKHGMQDSQDGFFREMARGLKSIRLPTINVLISGGVLNVGGDQPDAAPIGPRAGFVWCIQRLSVYGTTTTDSVLVFRNDPLNLESFIARIPLTPGVWTPGHRSLIINDTETLAFSGAGLGSPQIVISGEAVEVPGPMIWKVLG
jgi:hypothetical protein